MRGKRGRSLQTKGLSWMWRTRCKEEETTKPPWKLGALPRTMNVRDADAAPDCRNSVFGPVLFLHQKKYVRGGSIPSGSEARRRVSEGEPAFT